MKKIIILVLFVLIILASGLTYAVLTAEQLMMSYASRELGTRVSVEDVRVGWNRMTVVNVSVDNIEDSQLQPAFTSAHIDIEGTLASPLMPGRHAAHIHIHQPTVKIEFFSKDMSDSNWSRMLGEALVEADDGYRDPILVDHLLVTDLHLELVGGPVGKKPIEVIIERYEDTDLGEGSDVPVEAVAKSIAGVAVGRVVSNFIVPILIFTSDKPIFISAAKMDELMRKERQRKARTREKK